MKTDNKELFPTLRQLFNGNLDGLLESDAADV
jgi:hypothetical protein